MTRAAIAPFSLVLLAGLRLGRSEAVLRQRRRQRRRRSGAEPVWSRTGAEDDAAEHAAARTAGDAARRPRRGADRAAAQPRRCSPRSRSWASRGPTMPRRRAWPIRRWSALRRTPSAASGTNVEVELVAGPARHSRPAGPQTPRRRRVRGGEAPARTDDARPRRRSADRLLRPGRRRGEPPTARDRARSHAGRRRAGAPPARRRETSKSAKSRSSRPTVAQATIDLTRAQLAEGDARERFKVLLGLSEVGSGLDGALHLPPLPGRRARSRRARAALRTALDLGAARFGVDLVGRALALKRGTRFFPVGVEVGLNREKSRRRPAARAADRDRAADLRHRRRVDRPARGRAAASPAPARTARARDPLRGAADREERLGARSLVETYESVLLPKRRRSSSRPCCTTT